MLEKLRQHLAAGLQRLSVRLERAGTVKGLLRRECPVFLRRDVNR